MDKDISAAPETAPPPQPSPPTRRRLARSSRERMWAGVAGGMAEYFDIDPALVRLLWVAAAIITWGAAVGFYIIAWIVLPRDDAPTYTGTSRTSSGSYVASSGPASSSSPETPPTETDWWRSERYTGPQFDHTYGPRHHHPRTTGIVLVGLGVLLMAANLGLFSWVEWKTMWPLIFIGLGFLLLARQAGWRR